MGINLLGVSVSKSFAWVINYGSDLFLILVLDCLLLSLPLRLDARQLVEVKKEEVIALELDSWYMNIRRPSRLWVGSVT